MKLSGHLCESEIAREFPYSFSCLCRPLLDTNTARQKSRLALFVFHDHWMANVSVERAKSLQSYKSSISFTSRLGKIVPAPFRDDFNVPYPFDSVFQSRSRSPEARNLERTAHTRNRAGHTHRTMCRFRFDLGADCAGPVAITIVPSEEWRSAERGHRGIDDDPR
jgi:hypothetical protein